MYINEFIFYRPYNLENKNFGGLFNKLNHLRLGLDRFELAMYGKITPQKQKTPGITGATDFRSRLLNPL